MSRVDTYAHSDMEELDPHPRQAEDFAAIGSAAQAAALLAKAGSAHTLRAGNGTVLAICGIADIDRGYGHAWLFMSAHAARDMLWMTRVVTRYLARQLTRRRRIECMVRADWPAAVRWPHLLGFAEEGTMACAAWDGGDMVRFAMANREWRA